MKQKISQFVCAFISLQCVSRFFGRFENKFFTASRSSFIVFFLFARKRDRAKNNKVEFETRKQAAREEKETAMSAARGTKFV